MQQNKHINAVSVLYYAIRSITHTPCDEDDNQQADHTTSCQSGSERKRQLVTSDNFLEEGSCKKRQRHHTGTLRSTFNAVLGDEGGRQAAESKNGGGNIQSVVVSAADKQRENHSQKDEFAVIKIFNQALTIEENFNNKDDMAPWCKTKLKRVKSLLFYNLALSHHILGIKTGNSKKLQYALEAYQISYSFLEQVKDKLPMEHMILQLLALLNNMGNIYATQFDTMSACFCANWMHDAILSPEAKVLRNDEFVLFFQNVGIFPPQDALSLAPAA